MTPLFSDEPGWEDGREVQDRIAARLLLGCSCGGTLFENAPVDTPVDTPDPALTGDSNVAYLDLTCRACQHEDLVILFAGTTLLSDLERETLIAGEEG